jgi:hypothetical protein
MQLTSGDQMRCYDADELARRNHRCLLPESREVPQVAGHLIVGARRVSTLQEYTVGGIERHLERMRSDDATCSVLDYLNKLVLEAFSDFELRRRKHLSGYRW